MTTKHTTLHIVYLDIVSKLFQIWNFLDDAVRHIQNYKEMVKTFI